LAQSWKAYVVVALLIGLAIGASIAWIAKPAPPGMIPKEDYDKLKASYDSLKAESEKLRALASKLLEIAPEGVITVRVWGTDSPADVTRTTNIEAAADRLNKIFSALGLDISIKVEGEFFSKKELIDRFVAAWEAGEAPDIFAYKLIYPGAIDMIEAGYIVPLDEYISKYEDELADIYPKFWEFVTYKGKIWGLPQDTEARPLYFRKDVLRKLGWTEADIEALPEKISTGEWTMEDLIAVAKEAMDKGLVKWGVYHRKGFSEEFPFIAPYYQFGGRLLDPATGNLVLNKSAMLETFKLIHRMAIEEEILPRDMVVTDWRVIHTGFCTGEVLFWFGGTWHWAEWIRVKYNPDFTEEYAWKNIGFALTPAPRPGLKPITLSSPYVYFISAQSKCPELAFILAMTAISPPLDAKHAVDSGHLAVRKTTIGYPYYRKAKFLSDVTYMLEYTAFRPVHKDMPLYEKEWLTAFTAVEAGEKSPEEALASLVDALKAAIPDIIIEE